MTALSELGSLKKDELKAKCRARSLNVSGNKKDLVSIVLTSIPRNADHWFYSHCTQWHDIFVVKAYRFFILSDICNNAYLLFHLQLC